MLKRKKISVNCSKSVAFQKMSSYNKKNIKLININLNDYLYNQSLEGGTG